MAEPTRSQACRSAANWAKMKSRSEWVFTVKAEPMREGVTPWGEWSREYVLASAGQYASLYGGFMCPKYVEENGKVFYFAMSQFFPIYNIMWMRVELP